MSESIRYCETHTIPYFLCDRQQTLQLSMLVNYMIKVSSEQTAQIAKPLQDDYFKDQPYSWIILQYEFEIERLPRRNETVTFETYAQEYNRLFCYRTFHVYDEEGNCIVNTVATFGIMDLKKRKLIRVPKAIVEPYKAPFSSRIRRVVPPQDVTLSQALKKQYSVRYFDIDQNQHVNNSVYLTWMMDTLPSEFLVAHQVKSGVIKFEKEVSESSQVISYGQVVSDSEQMNTYHRVMCQEAISARATFTWQKRY